MSVGQRILRSLSTAQCPINPIQEALLRERCILVNEKDDILGHASKRKCHELDSKGQSSLHRAFSLFIFNEQYELLLQKRSDTKITFPSLWTNTCCSHPLFDVPGEKDGVEGVKKASRRRLFNELGVPEDTLSLSDITFLTRILYASPSKCGVWGENELDYILFYRGDVSISPNPEEVSDTLFLKMNELDDFIREGSKYESLTPWFQIISQRFLPHWWKSLQQIQECEDKTSIHSFY
uniref:isopentenyl-diphosphate Delta-isomerase n=1 Tax=Caligus clemensi TaxID=344056 RepID=C1C257_CALCM|nr:Isopentenyl-diphosphate Delta-isomerase I [Caligus clemensi]